MQQLSSIFLFYRPFVIWSFGVNIFLSVIGFTLLPLFLVKLFLVIFIWYLTNETQARHKLLFYKNAGISAFKLFSIFFFIDLLLSIPFLLVLMEFV
jgi:hypothetical protein